MYNEFRFWLDSLFPIRIWPGDFLMLQFIYLVNGWMFPFDDHSKWTKNVSYIYVLPDTKTNSICLYLLGSHVLIAAGINFTKLQIVQSVTRILKKGSVISLGISGSVVARRTEVAFYLLYLNSGITQNYSAGFASQLGMNTQLGVWAPHFNPSSKRNKPHCGRALTLIRSWCSTLNQPSLLESINTDPIMVFHTKPSLTVGEHRYWSNHGVPC